MVHPLILESPSWLPHCYKFVVYNIRITVTGWSIRSYRNRTIPNYGGIAEIVLLAATKRI